MTLPGGVSDAHDGRTVRTLTDMVEFGALAADLTARGRSAYDADIQLRLAGEAILHKLGEAAARLPDRLTVDNPDISFRAAKAMRNVIAHDYDRIDHDVVWVTLARDVPDLTRRIEALLSES